MSTCKHRARENQKLPTSSTAEATVIDATLIRSFCDLSSELCIDIKASGSDACGIVVEENTD